MHHCMVTEGKLELDESGGEEKGEVRVDRHTQRELGRRGLVGCPA